jgi:chromate transporter
MDGDSGADSKPTLAELARLFLRLGATAFGGPAAHVALMQEEVVRRRRWMSGEEFLDLLGAANLLPGPTSTELALFIGRALGGGPGLLLVGLAFVAPAAALTGALAWAYARGAGLPAAQAALAGVKPVVVAVVAQALWRLSRTALKTRSLALLASIAAAAALAGLDPLAILAASGFLMAGLASPPGRLSALAPAPLAAAAAPAAAAPAPWPLFLFFLKMGSVLFGSGYVLLAFLQDSLVERRHWLTSAQVLDAVAAGQLTPGPVFTTATFIGFLLGGPGGAVAATFGIFLPAFVLVALSGPLVPRLRSSRAAAAFLDGVNAASLGLMLAVLLALSRGVLVSVPSALIAAASLLLLARGFNSAWLVPAGAAAGLLVGR